MRSFNDLINNPLSEGFISIKDLDASWTNLIDIVEYLVSPRDESFSEHLLEIKKKKLSQVISDIYLKLQMVANVANQICDQIHEKITSRLTVEGIIDFKRIMMRRV